MIISGVIRAKTLTPYQMSMSSVFHMLQIAHTSNILNIFSIISRFR